MLHFRLSTNYRIPLLIDPELHHLLSKQRHHPHRPLEIRYREALFRVSTLWRCRFSPLHLLVFRARRSILYSKRRLRNSKSNKCLRLPPFIFTIGYLRPLSRGLTKSPQHPLVKALMTLRTSKMHLLTCVQNMSTRPRSARPIRTRPQTRHHSLGNRRRQAGGKELTRVHAMTDRNNTTSRTRQAVPIVDNGIKARLRLTAVVSDTALHGQSHVYEIRLDRTKDGGEVVHQSESARRAHEDLLYRATL